MATVLYGSEVAKGIRQQLSKKVEALNKEKKRLPKLVVILVGEHPASMSYVRGKEKACDEVGMLHEVLRFSSDVSQRELLEEIERLNQDRCVDGILVQLPLPSHIQEQEVIQAISPDKDVDGFHPLNVGKLMLQQDTFISCTPKGILRLLTSIDMSDLSGKHVVIVGRSNIVGKPLAQLFLQHHATLTTCHSKTKNLSSFTKLADILVVAVGQANLVKKDWVKKGAVVIDVGINRLEDHTLCGDVDFTQVKEVASYITPVPKGVGPMTIAMLLENTWESYIKRMEIKED